ncbi:tetraspanin-6-like [Bradysia coprophila]|uniref:tetraspanin-6-like n=1 Tax=Bradysia coprophila TaxID=38358 RepID=UPI00187DC3C2|nr:tetraspanin-6-like [Bradysia coprophila]
MEPNRRSAGRIKTKFDLGLAFWKYLMLLLNVGFVISSVLLISAGVSTYLTFKTMYNEMGDAFRMLSIFWMVVGVTTTAIGTFGIFVAFKENVTLANLYGIAMTFVFLGPISAGIADFTLISRSRYIASDLLDSMIKGYSYSNEYRYNIDYVYNYIYNFAGYSYYYEYDYRSAMDWIQTKFECCGNNGPSDWANLLLYWLPHHLQTVDGPINSALGEYPMPASCCVQNSNYVKLTCEKYHSTGCFEPIHQIFSETVMSIGTFGLFFSMLQMLAIILGFVYAQILRDKSRVQNYVNVSNSVQEEERNVSCC